VLAVRRTFLSRRIMDLLAVSVTITAVLLMATVKPDVATAFQPSILRPSYSTTITNTRALSKESTIRSSSSSSWSCLKLSDDWSNFQALDDDDEIVFGTSIDKTDYAVEDDSQEAKAAVGASLQAPEIERDAEPIDVPVGRSS